MKKIKKSLLKGKSNSNKVNFFIDELTHHIDKKIEKIDEEIRNNHSQIFDLESKLQLETNRNRDIVSISLDDAKCIIDNIFDRKVEISLLEAKKDAFLKAKVDYYE